MGYWMTRMGNMQRTGVADNGPTLPLKLSWKSGLGRNGTYIWNSPVSKDGIVFLTMQTDPKSIPFCLHALSIENGLVLWRREDIRCHSTGSATLEGEELFICDFFRILSLDPKSGATRWEFPVDKLIRETAPAVFESKVFFGSANGSMYSLDKRSGSLIWQFETDDRIMFSPSIWDEKVLFGTSPKEDSGDIMYALDIDTGEVIWKRQFSSNVEFHYNCTVALSDGRAYAAMEGSGLYSLDAETGDLIWLYETKSGPFSPPCLTNDTVYFAARGSEEGVHAVDVKSGNLLWVSEAGLGLSKSAPIVGGDHIFIGGGHWPVVYAFDKTSGEIAWEYKTDDMVYSTPALVENKLLIGSHDGYLYCFEEA